MVLNDDEKPLPPIAGSKQGLVTMKIPMYSKKEVSVSEDEVTALVEIKATSSAAVREGLDLVAVLDVSGSMEGHKIESAKKALQFVIMKLTPLDRLSVVTFNGSAQRLSPLRSMTPAAQKELQAIVGRLRADGGTDIKSGLVKGLEVLAGRVHTESRTANIFLMSDGKNEGKTSGDPRDVDPGDVVVYTFGFGKGTDHELLTKLAKNSTGGTYNSVPDRTDLSTSFAQLLGGLVTVVAQDVRLTLNPKRGPDLDAMTVAGGNDYKQTVDASGLITIKFGNLFSGEVRTVAVDFKLKNREKEPRDFGATLAVAEHSYAAQERRQSPMNVRVKRSRNPSPPDGAGLEERTVQAEQLRRQHAENIREASALAHAERLEEAREKVAEGQNAIEDMMLDDEERTLNVLRAELLQLYAYMDTQKLYDELGHPYALATIISHGRQRTAGRGDEQEVFSLYVTPRMVAYLQQAKRFEENPADPVPSADDDVKQEILSNPLAAVAAPLAFYLDDAIHALQAIQQILADASSQR